MTAEMSVNLESLKPGAYVAQAPKKVCRTEWTEDQITVHYEDGSTLVGAYADAVTVVRTAAQKHADVKES